MYLYNRVVKREWPKTKNNPKPFIPTKLLRSTTVPNTKYCDDNVLDFFHESDYTFVFFKNDFRGEKTLETIIYEKIEKILKLLLLSDPYTTIMAKMTLFNACREHHDTVFCFKG